MHSPDSLGAAVGGPSAEDVLLPVLWQLAVILAAAKLFAALARRLGQPGVVGEIAAGLVLGPSVFGRLLPAGFAAVFHPTMPGLDAAASDALLAWVLGTLSQLGLVFLLFLVGLEFDYGHLRWHGATALGISVAGIVVPFGLGFGLAHAPLPWFGDSAPATGFGLFLGTTLSITAIPVLGRIMSELGITRTRLATLTIAAAAADDATGWLLLAAVASAVRAAFEPWRTATSAGAAAAFVLAAVLLGEPLRAAARRAARAGVSGLAVLLVATLLCAALTSSIGVFAVFGPFILGAALSPEPSVRAMCTRRLGGFVAAFFVPLFFAFTGLRTDVGSLDRPALWGLAALVTAVAVLGKFGGCAAAARLAGLGPREAGCVGALMNTRGLMALVVINAGRDLGVIPPAVYTMLALMALATTAVTTPLLRLLAPGTELEPHLRASGFLPPTNGRLKH